MEKKPTKSTEDVAHKQGWFLWRYVIAFLGFFGMINSYTIRSHISVTLVAMVNSTDSTTENYTECGAWSNSTSSDRSGDFNWDSRMQGIIQGAFFWGYMIPQLLGGRLAELYGGKMVIFVGGVIATIATLIGPWAANVHVGFFIATRIICGVGLSVFTPSLHTIIARWCPPNERSRFSSIVYSGNQLGTIIAMPVAGALCQYASNGGWPWPFYVFGIIASFWLVLWVIFVYNVPSDHRWISEGELQYIEDSLKDTLNKKARPVPWKAIFTSTAVWALTWVHFGQNWGFYTLLTEIPTYMSHVLGFDMAQNGLYSSLPYIVMVVFGNICSVTADMLIKRNILSVGFTRKLFNSIALFGTAISLLIITFLKCQTMTIYALLVLAVGFDGAIYGGFQINHVDLSPNFAGTLQGITNTMGCIPGIVSPYITGVITEDNDTQDGWSVVFYIAFALLVFFAIEYVLFGKGTTQPWNESSPLKELDAEDISNISNKDVNLVETNLGPS